MNTLKEKKRCGEQNRLTVLSEIMHNYKSSDITLLKMLKRPPEKLFWLQENGMINAVRKARAGSPRSIKDPLFF